MEPISNRLSTQSTAHAIDAAGPSAAAGVQAGSGEALAQRVDLLSQIAVGLAQPEQNPARLDQAIDGLTKLIADLSADREALSGQRAALSSTQPELHPHVLQLIARLADPDTKKAMRLADKNLNQAVAGEVRSFTAHDRMGAPTALGMGPRIPVPKLSELSAVVQKFPNLETLDLGRSLERFDGGTLVTGQRTHLEGHPDPRQHRVPDFKRTRRWTHPPSHAASGFLRSLKPRFSKPAPILSHPFPMWPGNTVSPRIESADGYADLVCAK